MFPDVRLNLVNNSVSSVLTVALAPAARYADGAGGLEPCSISGPQAVSGPPRHRRTAVRRGLSRQAPAAKPVPAAPGTVAPAVTRISRAASGTQPGAHRYGAQLQADCQGVFFVYVSPCVRADCPSGSWAASSGLSPPRRRLSITRPAAEQTACQEDRCGKEAAVRQVLQIPSHVGSDESAEIAYRIDQSHSGSSHRHRHRTRRGSPEGTVVGQGSGDGDADERDCEERKVVPGCHRDHQGNRHRRPSTAGRGWSSGRCGRLPWR